MYKFNVLDDFVPISCDWRPIVNVKCIAESTLRYQIKIKSQSIENIAVKIKQRVKIAFLWNVNNLIIFKSVCLIKIKRNLVLSRVKIKDGYS